MEEGKFIVGFIILMALLAVSLVFVYSIEVQPFIIKNTCESFMCSGIEHTIGYHCECLN